MAVRNRSPETTLQEVLVPVGEGDADRVDRLARTVVGVARPAGATVRVVHVFEEDEYEGTRDRLNFDPRDENTPDDAAGRYGAARALARRLEAAGVDVVLRGRVGDPAGEVVELADETDADMVVVGGRKRSPTGKAVFGSTAQAIAMNAPCPVTFVRDD